MIANSASIVDVIPGYDLHEIIGEGGAGIVYRATQLATGRLVAVKTVRALHEGSLASLRREVQVLARIKHPGVIQILDVGATDNGLPWYAMELLEGRSLSGWLRGSEGQHSTNSTEIPRSPAPPSAPSTGSVEAETQEPRATRHQLLSIVCKLCTPLSYLHGQGIVHRDLKPSNVFVVHTGLPVLVDFGMVWPAPGGDLTLLEAQLARGGTTGYMAPEQIRGELVDARADLYAIGCVLYHIVAGQPAFEGTVADIMQQHLHSVPLPPSALQPDVEPELEQLIMSLLEKRPSRRMGYAGDVAEVLQRLGAEPWSSPEVPSPRPYVYRSPLVGRDDLLRQMTRDLDTVRGGEARVVLVGGPSGIGKTTFSAETARTARARGFSVVAGECHPVGLDGADSHGPVSLRAFSPFLRAVSDRCITRGPKEVERLLGDHGAVLSLCEPRLSKIGVRGAAPDSPLLPGLDARRRMFDALANTLNASLDDGPLMLVIDDLQWADELSLRFLADLPPELLGRPLLILATYRTEQSEVVESVVSARHTTSVVLSELDTPALASAVSAMLGIDAPNDPVVNGVTERSGGNPFFAAEYLLAAIAEGLLIRTPRRRWQLSSELRSFGDMPLPRSLNELIVRRIERLSPVASSVLASAAIVGREVALDVLLAMAKSKPPNLGEDEVLDGISELKAKQIFEQGDSGTLRFVHDRLREVSYERIASGELTALHLAAATILEERFSAESTLAVSAATLAHHFERGGNPDRAIVYLEKAADHARRSFSNTETIGLLRSAIRLADAGSPVSDLTRARWHRLIGEAHAGEGHHAESIQDLHRAVELLGMPVPPSATGTAIALFKEVARQMVHRMGPARLANSRLSSVKLRTEAARAYDLLMPVTYYTTGNLPKILLASLRNLNIAESLGPSSELGLAYGNAQATAGLIPWHRLARTYEQAGRGVSQVISDEIARTWVLVMNSVYHVGLAHWDIAREQAEEARTIAERLQFHRRWEEATGVLATIEFLSGHSAAALTLYEEQMKSAQRGDGQTRIWAGAGMAQALIRLGRPADACDAAREAVALLAKQGRPEQIFARGVLALALWTNDRRDDAIAAANEALRIICAGEPISFYCANAYACVAQTFVEAFAAGDLASRAPAETACAQLVKSARIFPVSAAARDLWSGRLAGLTGRRKREARLYRRSVTLASDLRMDHDQRAAAKLLQTIPAP